MGYPENVEQIEKYEEIIKDIEDIKYVKWHKQQKKLRELNLEVLFFEDLKLTYFSGLELGGAEATDYVLTTLRNALDAEQKDFGDFNEVRSTLIDKARRIIKVRIRAGLERAVLMKSFWPHDIRTIGNKESYLNSSCYPMILEYDEYMEYKEKKELRFFKCCQSVSTVIDLLNEDEQSVWKEQQKKKKEGRYE